MMHFKFIYLIIQFFLITPHLLSNEKIDVIISSKNITLNVEVAKNYTRKKNWSHVQKKSFR